MKLNISEIMSFKTLLADERKNRERVLVDRYYLLTEKGIRPEIARKAIFWTDDKVKKELGISL